MQKNNINILVVLDLDGTVISINSFRIWLFLLLMVLFLSFRWVTLIKLLIILYQRLCRKITRQEMKEKMTIYSTQYRFISNILAYFIGIVCYFFIRKNLIDSLERLLFQIKDGDVRVVVASAAAEFYINSILKSYPINIEMIIGSKITESGYFECYSEYKADMVMFMKRYYSPDSVVFYTDHHEDIPTAKISDKVVLVEPDAETISKFKKEKINFVNI